jgi:hypothetical protein
MKQLSRNDLSRKAITRDVPVRIVRFEEDCVFPGGRTHPEGR